VKSKIWDLAGDKKFLLYDINISQQYKHVERNALAPAFWNVVSSLESIMLQMFL